MRPFGKRHSKFRGLFPDEAEKLRLIRPLERTDRNKKGIRCRPGDEYEAIRFQNDFPQHFVIDPPGAGQVGDGHPVTVK